MSSPITDVEAFAIARTRESKRCAANPRFSKISFRSRLRLRGAASITGLTREDLFQDHERRSRGSYDEKKAGYKKERAVPLRRFFPGALHGDLSIEMAQ